MFLLIIGVALTLLIANRYFTLFDAFTGSLMPVIVGVNAAGDIYSADQNIDSNPNWAKIPGSAVNVSYSNNKLFAVNSAGNIYYSSDYKSGNWVQVPGALTQVSFENTAPVAPAVQVVPAAGPPPAQKPVAMEAPAPMKAPPPMQMQPPVAMKAPPVPVRVRPPPGRARMIKKEGFSDVSNSFRSDIANSLPFGPADFSSDINLSSDSSNISFVRNTKYDRTLSNDGHFLNPYTEN